MNYRSDSQNKNIRVSTCGKFRVIRIPYGVNWIYSAEYLHETPTKAGHMAQSWKKVTTLCRHLKQQNNRLHNTGD